MLKYSKAFLSKLEDLINEGGFLVRYEKGNFKSGYCVLKENKLVLVNNFLPLEGRINILLELVKNLHLDQHHLSEKSRKLFQFLEESQKTKSDSLNQTTESN